MRTTSTDNILDPKKSKCIVSQSLTKDIELKGDSLDGAKAVEEATKASELTNWKKAHYVGTLAAAYAEAGDFKSAVKRQKKAIDLLTEEEEEMRADFEERLKLYQSGKPYRED
ncbi:hypothetical protein ES703_20482 [subsurface metagenome]